jgi:hypothetical protein
MHALHSPFGALAPRAALAPKPIENPLIEPNPRLNVVASASIDKFNGIPLGAYQVSMPYSGPADVQAGSCEGQPQNGAMETGRSQTKQ